MSAYASSAQQPQASGSGSQSGAEDQEKNRCAVLDAVLRWGLTVLQ
jgi:hypothetical protein